LITSFDERIHQEARLNDLSIRSNYRNASLECNPRGISRYYGTSSHSSDNGKKNVARDNSSPSIFLLEVRWGQVAWFGVVKIIIKDVFELNIR